jgi:predicted nucleic acid-binding protein
MVIVSDASPIIALASLDILIRNDFRISDILYQQILERAGE